jgi:hypothetical protein
MTENSIVILNTSKEMWQSLIPPPLGEGKGGGFYKSIQEYYCPPPNLPQRGRNQNLRLSLLVFLTIRFMGE